jgi:hypothetical protein
MNCESANERLTEAARRGAQPDAVLRAHLEGCEVCSERWQEQRALTGNLRIMKIRAAGRRSPDAVRDSLLREFAARNHGTAASRTSHRWLWSVAAAAVLLAGVMVIRDVAKKPPPIAPEMAVSEIAYEETDPQEEGFIEVPYAPPLAQGELVRVIHTELQPAALAGMGVNVDPTWITELPADLLVGQDGFPRAVRVSDDSLVDGGS